MKSEEMDDRPALAVAAAEAEAETETAAAKATSWLRSAGRGHSGDWCRLRRINCAFVVAMATLCSFMAACPYVDGNVFGYKGFAKRDLYQYQMEAQTFLHFLSNNREAMCSSGDLQLRNAKVAAYCRDATLADRFVHIGLVNGYKICQSMFRNERWNCTFAAPFLNSGYPQAAFVWAITVSKAIEELVMACRKGVPGLDCPCHQAFRPRPRQKQQQQQQRQQKQQGRKRKQDGRRRPRRPRRSIALGKEQLKMLNPEKISEKYGNLNVPTCDDNIALASQRVREFFHDSRGFSPGMDFTEMVNFHNRRAGHIVVKRSRVSICNCLGISGSCSKKICIRGLRRHSRRIESNMQKLFVKSKYVRPEADQLAAAAAAEAAATAPQSASSQRRRRPSRLLYQDEKLLRPKRVRKKLLVYTNRPPDFCRRNDLAGYFGVDDRQCNLTVSRADHSSCDHLCCGPRNYRVAYNYLSDWCDCQMRYNPIKVECKRCEKQIEIHRCRVRHVYP